MRFALFSLLVVCLVGCGDTDSNPGSFDLSGDTDSAGSGDAGGDTEYDSDAAVEDALDTHVSDAVQDQVDETDPVDAALDVELDLLVDTTDLMADPDVVLDSDGSSDPDVSTEADGGTDPPIDSAFDSEPVVEPPPVFETMCGLLTNGNAEIGNTSGWTVGTGEFLSVDGTGFGGFPSAYEGVRYFYGGDAGSSEMSQTIDVSEWSVEIDDGEMVTYLTARVRSFNGNDEATLIVIARGGDGLELDRSEIGPYDTDSWTLRVVELLIPAGTRQLTVSLGAERHDGSSNDAYFDMLDLCVDDQVAPPFGELLSPPYLMWVTQNEVSVRWETSEPSIGRVDYGHDGWLEFSISEDEPVTTHELRLTGLNPGETAYYEISWGDSSRFPTRAFETAPGGDDDGPFTFLAWGDNQDGVVNFRRLIPLMVAENPVFTVSVGDIVSEGGRNQYREQLFGPISPLADHVPFLVGAGNHERYVGDGDAALFEEYVSQPGDEHCFGWRWGPLYFLFIDTGVGDADDFQPGSEQYDCYTGALESDEATTATFQLAVFHKPPRMEWWNWGAVVYPTDMEAPWIRDYLEPQLEALGVDLVFNGHNHLYAYTPAVTETDSVWVTCGGAGGGLDTTGTLNHVDDWPEIAVTIHQHHFVSVTYDSGALTVEAINMAGEVIHSFTVPEES